MEWRKFGIIRRLTSTKEKMSSLFRVIKGLENEESNNPSMNLAFQGAPQGSVNSPTSFALEVELKKAEALEYWRKRLDNLAK